jgi:hypothetical protein
MDGYFVSSKEMPSHTEDMGIWVPYRFKRKWKRRLLQVRAGAELKPNEEGHLDQWAADKALIELLREVPISWNWANGTGEPLPQPGDDPDVWEEISDEELVFIVANLNAGTVIPPQKSTA